MARILWFNWRDIKHPDAGGAEVYTHEVASRLVKKGYDITLFTADIPSRIKQEVIDGVKIVRNGGKFNVYKKAEQFYKKNKRDFDVIIDEINGRPFLTPKYIKDKPIIAVFHQSIKEEWFYETSFPINYLCYYYLERKWLSFYKGVTILTVSNSSKEDLIHSYKLDDVIIAPNGLNINPLQRSPQKSDIPTLIFVGRMKKHKLPDHAISAFKIIKNMIPNAQMNIIGDGYFLAEIRKKFNVSDTIFHGKVDSQRKLELLSTAHIMLMPSVREGWGLVVTEANAMGTPAIGYNVPGLSDSIQHNKTGFLTMTNTPENIAEIAINLLNDPVKLQKLSHNALEFSKTLSWDKTVEIYHKVITLKLS